jgi:hypothetical protein
MKNRDIIKIESREHLLHTLMEASELEHNLMCLYLFASFSLKQADDNSLNATEHKHVRAWEKVIKTIAIQEMGHLALVSNLISAIGGTATFRRPDFPVRPGYYPSDFIIELSPFSMSTLEHFIFLERPADSDVQTSEEFEASSEYKREAPLRRLMSHVGDYETVAELYSAIGTGLEHLVESLGDEKVFCGSASLQLSEDEIKLTGLAKITDLRSAKDAIKVIIEQGEGGECEDCHFHLFEGIRAEYLDLLSKNPSFNPARDCAKNPAMRKPPVGSEKIWIEHSRASAYLDIANALYGLLLKFLTQLYHSEQRSPQRRKDLLNGTFKLMASLAAVSKILPDFPVSTESSFRAGVSFSIDRDFGAFELSCERALLHERISDILKHAKALKDDKLESVVAGLTSMLDLLHDRESPNLPIF